MSKATLSNMLFECELIFDISTLDEARRKRRCTGWHWLRTLDFSSYYLLVFTRKP